MTSDSGSTNCKKVKELPKIDTSYLSEGPVPSSTTSSNKSESYIPAEQMVYSSAVSRNNEVNRSNLENNDLAGSTATLTYGRLSIPKVMKMFIKNKLYFNEKGIIVKDLSTLPGFESLKEAL